MLARRPISFWNHTAVIVPDFHCWYSWPNFTQSIGIGCRPLYFPWDLAMAIPSRCLCRVCSRSSSESAANIDRTNRPCGVLVSMFSLLLTRVTCFRWSTSIMLSRSRVERPSLLILSIYRVSPSRTYSSIAFNSGRSAFLPDIFSAKIRSTWYCFIRASWRAVSWCSVDTLIYPILPIVLLLTVPQSGADFWDVSKLKTPLLGTLFRYFSGVP